eukprot:6997451-Alexandrium_andersonii.AAC.1
MGSGQEAILGVDGLERVAQLPDLRLDGAVVRLHLRLHLAQLADLAAQLAALLAGRARVAGGTPQLLLQLRPV